jgi:hypothetical protein
MIINPRAALRLAPRAAHHHDDALEYWISFYFQPAIRLSRLGARSLSSFSDVRLSELSLAPAVKPDDN